MTLKKVEVYVPEELMELLGPTSETVKAKVLEQLVMGLVRDGEISMRYGADMLGLTYHDMLELMGKHNVPIISYDDPQAEVEQELRLLENYPK